MAIAGDNSRFNRVYLEAKLAALKGAQATLILRIETLKSAGMDASPEEEQLAQTNEQIAGIDAQLKSLGA